MAEAVEVAGTAAAFGDLLKRYRVVAGLTQEALAEQAHLSVRAISDLERGIKRLPRRDTLALLVEALQLSPQVRVAFEAAARPVTALSSTPHPGLQPAFGPARASPFVGRDQELALTPRCIRRTRWHCCWPTWRTLGWWRIRRWHR